MVKWAKCALLCFCLPKAQVPADHAVLGQNHLVTINIPC